jgi:hypothetical protein
MLFHLRKLKYFGLQASKPSLTVIELFDQLHFLSTHHSSTIERLCIIVYCHWSTEHFILSCTTSLQQCQIQSSFSHNQTLSPSKLCFPCIRKLTLQTNGSQTAVLRGILRNAPHLSYCKLIWSVYPFHQHRIDLRRSKICFQSIETYAFVLTRLRTNSKFRSNDVQNLNSQLSYCSDNGEQRWKVTGILTKI